eukprot:UN01248
MVAEYVLPVVALPSCLLGSAVAAYYAWKIASTPIDGTGLESSSENAALVNSNQEAEGPEMYDRVRRISGFISEGANAFLFAEYRILSFFVVAFAIFLFAALALGSKHDAYASAGFATLAFVLGAATSTASGFLGMRIAVTANSRTAIAAKVGYRPAFNTSLQAGMVMGFGLSSIGLMVLMATVYIFRVYFKEWQTKADVCHRLFEAVSGYGLGGSAIALFGRVGGGIYTKAADVGADLSGKVIEDFPEDDPRNPAVIADNVGDNVGDIAGMGADLFGSLAEGSCAAMVIASTTTLHTDWVALNFPILLLSVSLISSWLVSFLATTIKPVDTQPQIEPALKLQLVASTVVMSIFSTAACLLCLPKHISYLPVGNETVDNVVKFTNAGVLACVLLGLWTGLIIGYITDYYTSFAHNPVKELTQACTTGAATNVIYGLALGYKSTIIPVACLSVTIYTAFRVAGLYGVAAAALGVLGNIATALTIDAYGPICDNAGGIAEMCHMPSHTRERTDALDAAGNTTAAIGKGSAIASAILVALALFGAFISSSTPATPEEAKMINLLDPKTLAGLLFGAMLPYWFSALTMKSVGDAAYSMVVEVQRQLDVSTDSGRLIRQQKQDPDYARCIEISTRASLREMIAPGALVIITPIVTGFVVGRLALAGLLIGNLISGTQMAISASNTGGAFDNAKKLLTALGVDKKSEQFKASVVGDTVGDPLKDTSGPSINILIKLSAIISVVLAPAFPKTSLLEKIIDKVSK